MAAFQQTFIDGAESGYNKGYHDAEEHYLNVIDNQHKLVDESKKKDYEKIIHICQERIRQIDNGEDVWEDKNV